MINLVLIINIFYKILIIPIQIEKSSKTEIQNICLFFSKKKKEEFQKKHEILGWGRGKERTLVQFSKVQKK